MTLTYDYLELIAYNDVVRPPFVKRIYNLPTKIQKADGNANNHRT